MWDVSSVTCEAEGGCGFYDGEQPVLRKQPQHELHGEDPLSSLISATFLSSSVPESERSAPLAVTAGSAAADAAEQQATTDILSHLQRLLLCDQEESCRQALEMRERDVRHRLTKRERDQRGGLGQWTTTFEKKAAVMVSVACETSTAPADMTGGSGASLVSACSWSGMGERRPPYSEDPDDLNPLLEIPDALRKSGGTHKEDRESLRLLLQDRRSAAPTAEYVEDDAGYLDSPFHSSGAEACGREGQRELWADRHQEDHTPNSAPVVSRHHDVSPTVVWSAHTSLSPHSSLSSSSPGDHPKHRQHHPLLESQLYHLYACTDWAAVERPRIQPLLDRDGAGRNDVSSFSSTTTGSNSQWQQGERKLVRCRI